MSLSWSSAVGLSSLGISRSFDSVVNIEAHELNFEIYLLIDTSVRITSPHRNPELRPHLDECASFSQSFCVDSQHGAE